MSYFHHSFNAITFGLTQSDYIKRLLHQKWHLIVKAGSADLGHVPRVQEEEEILDVLAHIGHRGHDEAGVLRCGLGIRNKNGLGWMSESVALPSHGLARFHVHFCNRVGEMSAIHRVQPPEKKAVFESSLHLE